MTPIRKGVIGSGSDKFTPIGEQRAKARIREILTPVCCLVSGHSIMKGIDIWSEEIFVELHPDIQPMIQAPQVEQWPDKGVLKGYMSRNLDIARLLDELYVIVANHYPLDFPEKEKVPECYHCHTTEHIKSGACWTALRARELNKPVFYTIVANEA